MKPVAHMLMNETGGIRVEITDETFCVQTETVYIWTSAAGDWLRVGTSSGPLNRRLLAYAKDINKSLVGEKSPSPSWEANRWRELTETAGPLIALAHRPEPVPTIAGPVRPYLDIERALIREKKPPLNRSHR